MLPLRPIYQRFIAGFALFWILFVFLDYWKNHLVYYLSFENFQYSGFSFLLAILTGGLIGLHYWLKNRKKPIRFVNGIAIGGLALLLTLMVVSSVFNQIEVKPRFGTDGAIILMSRMIFISLSILLFVLTPSFALGQWVKKLLKVKNSKLNNSLVSIAIGLVIISLLIFIFGSLHLLYAWIFYPLLVGILAIFWRSNLNFLKNCLWTPLSIHKQLNALGIISFVLLVLFISMNFVQIIRPYPFGFDALSLYMNLPTLIYNEGGLLEGYQPHNWSLIMSLGYILFGKTEFVMAISFLGGLLSVFVIFQLSRKWLDVNLSLLSTFLFYSLPAVNFQSFKDMKIDLGLLYITLCIVVLFVEWLGTINDKKTNKKKSAISFWKRYNLIILMGILSGFALGIKFTAVFMLIALVGGLWYSKAGKLAFVAIFCLGMFAILLLRIDDISGLRAYHLSATLVQWLMLGLGLIFLGITFFRNKTGLITCFKLSLIYASFAILVFLPWPIKNIIENPGLNPQTILFGQPPGVKTNIQEFEQNYERIRGGN